MFQTMVVNFSILIGLKIENISEVLAMHGIDLTGCLRLHHFKFKINHFTEVVSEHSASLHQ